MKTLQQDNDPRETASALSVSRDGPSSNEVLHKLGFTHIDRGSNVGSIRDHIKNGVVMFSSRDGNDAWEALERLGLIKYED